MLDGRKWRRRATALAAVVCALAYAGLAAREYLAYRAAHELTPEGLGRSLRLSGGNATVHYALGKYAMAAEGDTERAQRHLRRAAELNPGDARPWLDLALMHQFAGNQQAQAEALRRAAEAEPNTPSVAWEVANFYLLRGERDQALRFFRNVLGNGGDAPETFRLLWRSLGDAAKIADILPPDPKLHGELLRFLLGSGEERALQQAPMVWRRWMALDVSFPPAQGFFYLDWLLGQWRAEEAREAWTALLRHAPPPVAAPGRAAVYNGGFEEPVLNGGLDWRHAAPAGVSISIDSREFQAGTRSAYVTFDGNAIQWFGLEQLVPVTPGAEYELSCWAKSEEIVSSSGPRWIVRSGRTFAALASTGEMLGSTGWRQYTARFRVPADVPYVRVSLGRSPHESAVRGALWVDEITLTEVR